MLRCFAFQSAMVILLLQSVAIVLIFGWYMHLMVEDSPPSPGKVHVLLLSSWRSGSSFLGQVFSQHPSVFYLMEPAWHIWMTLRQPSAHGLRMAVRDLVRSVFQCDLSVMDAYLPPEPNISQVFMWSHSRALCSPPACSLTKRGQMSVEHECQRKCNIVGLQRAEAACLSYSHVVLKEVRFLELESLYPLLKDPTLDLRIIHLVRDPRAVFHSREKVAKDLELDSMLVLNQTRTMPTNAQQRVMQEVCRSHVRIHKTAMLKPPNFLQGRYRLIRYEDLVRNPLEEILKMYEFVGLEMTETLQKWIYHITHGLGRGAKENAFRITSRNAEDVSLAWRNSLPHQQVRQIQDVCKEAMSLIGYQLVESEEKQKQLNLTL